MFREPSSRQPTIFEYAAAMAFNHFDDDDFWRNVEPFMFSEERWDRAEQDALNTLALTSTPPRSTILDLACGPGRHAIAFARLGFGVRAIDRSAYFIDRATERTPSSVGHAIEYILSDISSLPRQEGPKLAIMLFNSFGYSSSESNAALISHIGNIIDDDCCFLLSVVGKEVVARDFRATSCKTIEGGVLNRRSEISAGWKHLIQHWTIIRGDCEPMHHTTIQELYSGVELSNLLRKAGFSMVRIFGDLNGTYYDNTATQLLALARKD